jgi:hypothetical protein
MVIPMARNSGTYTATFTDISFSRRARSSLLPLIGFLIGFLPSFGATALTNYPAPWEGQFHLPAQDANGFSILTPSADSRLMYVSSTGGNDGTAQAYSPSDSLVGSNPYNPVGAIKPYATIQAALAQARQGYPDYVLLKRGDSWTLTKSIAPLAGRSYSERSVIAYYGTSVNRPLVNVAEAAWQGLNYSNSGNYSAVLGIEFYGYQHDPASPSFIGFSNINDNLTGFNLNNNGNQFFGVLIEDCKFNYFVANVVQSFGSFNNTTDATSSVVIRRNIISKHYGNSGKAYGLFMYQQPMLFEENILDHDGWYQQSTSGGAGGANGQATVLSQGTYMDNASNSIVRKNIYLRNGSLSMKFRADGANNVNAVIFKNLIVDNNLVLEGEVAISLGGNITYNNGPRFGNVSLVNNVAMDVGKTMPTARGLGWGIDIQDWQTGVVSNNIMAHWGSDTVNNAYAISVIGTTTNVPIKNNIFYDVTVTGQWAYTNSTALVRNTSKQQNVSFQSNIFYSPRGSNLLNMDGNGPTFSNNSYYSSSTGNIFSAAGSAMTLSSWLGKTGETASPPSFVDANRTVQTYLTSKGQSGSTDALANILAQQSKFNWNSSYTADAINSYIRAGFCLTGQSCAAVPTTPPTTISSPPSAPALLPVLIGPGSN